VALAPSICSGRPTSAEHDQRRRWRAAESKYSASSTGRRCRSTFFSAEAARTGGSQRRNFHRAFPQQALHQNSPRPNLAVKRTRSGTPPGPGRRYAVHFRQPGPGVVPLWSAYLYVRHHLPANAALLRTARPSGLASLDQPALQQEFQRGATRASARRERPIAHHHCLGRSCQTSLLSSKKIAGIHVPEALHRCCLTRRSRRGPTAGHQARRAATSYHLPVGPGVLPLASASPPTLGFTKTHFVARS
jgi:hypothetical protein